MGSLTYRFYVHQLKNERYHIANMLRALKQIYIQNIIENMLRELKQIYI
jgi:hypothetical protein